VLTLAAIAAASVAQGAYHRGGQLLGGLLLATALAVALRHRELRMTTLRRPPVLLSLVLAGWAMVSGVVGGFPAAGVPTALLLVGVVFVAVVCLHGGHELAGALVLIGSMIALTGLVGVAWRLEPWALEGQGLWRAATTLTYANAAAGLLVPLALLAVGRVMADTTSAPAAGALCILLTGTAATMSRGGIVSLGLGAVVMARLVGFRRMARAVRGPVMGAAIAVGGLAPSMVILRPPRPILAMAGLALGLAVSVLSSRLHRAQTPIAAGVFLVAALLVASGSAGRLLSAADGTRLSLTSADRVRESAAALRVAASEPVTGVGPGRATLSWHNADGRRFVAHYAHNEYLQTLAELGAVGLALVLALVTSLVVAVRRSLGHHPEPYAAGAAAGLTALALHSSFDFLWHIPAIPLVAAALVGLCCSARQGASL